LRILPSDTTVAVPGPLPVQVPAPRVGVLMAARNISSNGSEMKRNVRLQCGRPSAGKNGLVVAGSLSGV